MPVLMEHKRVLAPGGTLIFSVSFPGRTTEDDLAPDLCAEERMRRFRQADRIRIFSADDFIHLTRKVFAQDVLFSPSATGSDGELEGWGIPTDFANRVRGVTNFVWQKLGAQDVEFADTNATMVQAASPVLEPASFGTSR